MAKILFLPGAGASPDFWKPVGALLPADWPKEYFGWPGLGRPAARPCDQGHGRSGAHGRRQDGRAGRPGGAVHGRRHRRAAGDRAAAERAPAGADRDLGRRRHGGARRHPTGARAIASPFRARQPGSPSRSAPVRCRSRRSPRRRCCCGAMAIRSARPPSAGICSRASRTRACTSSPGGDHDLAQHACGRGGAADRAPSRLIRPSAGVPAG